VTSVAATSGACALRSVIKTMKSQLSLGCSAVVLMVLASCSSYPRSRNISEFTVAGGSIDMREPYALLASSRETVSYGDILKLRLTLVNPTNRPIELPNDKLGMLNGSLSVEWAMDGIEEGYFTGADMSSFSTSVPAERRQSLGPGQMIDYEILWRSTCPDEGRIDIELDFHFGGDQSCKIRIRSHQKANKLRHATANRR
jgi:hypothetical protein